jgi:hypothetical protein
VSEIAVPVTAQEIETIQKIVIYADEFLKQ